MRVAAIALVGLAIQAIPPQVTQVQEWFEAGRYQQVVDVASQASEPQAQYLVASSFDRLGLFDEARRVYGELSSRGDTDPWSWVGRSAQALVGATSAPPAPVVLGQARDAAMQAVGASTSSAQGSTVAPAAAASGPSLAYANYQLGQVLTFERDYAQAAAAFDKAAEIDPSLAYAYYYAGMSYREITRIDLMAIRFDRFLELAPEAPERTRVQAIMRTVRGR